jgi:hypothetical protein
MLLAAGACGGAEAAPDPDPVTAAEAVEAFGELRAIERDLGGDGRTL